MKQHGENLVLDKADLIRMNKLVRSRTNFEGFLEWYSSLSVEGQAALGGELCHAAYQAGVDETIYESASREAELENDKPFLGLMRNVHGPGGLNVGGLVSWFQTTNESNRSRAF